MSLSNSKKACNGFLESPKAYSQPKCYARVCNDLKSIQCYELVEILSSAQRPEVLVCNEVTNKCVEVQSTDELVVTEVSGSEVFANVKEGDYVRRGDKLAYIVTGKGEVRSVRSSSEGLVVLVYEVPTSRPSRIIIFVKEGKVSG